MLHALGGGHSFESALADIIDNSIDARASRVGVRFILEDARLIAVQIRDDGTGMSQESLTDALRLGGRRDYSSTDLGHFGIGLKAASMRHANRLTVYTAINDDAGLSVAAATLDPSDSPDGTLGIRVLERRRAEFGYAYGYESDPSESGTIIEWTELRATSDAAALETRQEWLDHRLETTRAFLGLAFHRMLEAGDLRIEIDVFDAAGLFAGIPRRVEPVNPFGYQLSGRTGYPRILSGRLPDESEISAVCHVLPPKGIDRGLPGKREDWQGIYVYRNDRLLTVEPDWMGLAVAKSELRLARMSIELTDELLPFVKPNPEKNGVEFNPAYANALQASVDPVSNIAFEDYLDHARSAWKESTKRTTDKPLTEIAEGLPARLLQQIGESFGWRTGHDPASIVWEKISEDEVFRVDLDRRMLVMNSTHVDLLGGEDSAQASAISILLYLLVESNFTRSSHLRSTTRDHLEQIDDLLLTALYPAVGGRASTFRGFPTDALTKLRAALTSSVVSVATPHWGQESQDSADMRDDPVATPAGHDGNAFEITLLVNEDDPEGAESAIVPVLPTADEVPGAATEPSVFTQQENSTVAVGTGPAARPERRLGPSDPLDADDLAAFEAYCDGAGIGEIAAELGRDKSSVARSLALAVFGSKAVDDDASLAPFHGLPYTPDERDRIIAAYRSSGSDSVVGIARDNGRTPLAIAWLLLDSPKRPVAVDKRVRKNVRRRAVGSDANAVVPQGA
ncbi:ATP-binding protein [Leucobacter soli]|uniref:ATP-binding protein n=1 Tax=Leucobacter soli TaxID=2812850 RepID=UPI003611AF53